MTREYFDAYLLRCGWVHQDEADARTYTHPETGGKIVLPVTGHVDFEAMASRAVEDLAELYGRSWRDILWQIVEGYSKGDRSYINPSES